MTNLPEDYSKRKACPPLALFSAVISLFLLFPAAGCTVKPVRKTAQPEEMNVIPVKAVIEAGDWLVIRGVTDPSNFISSVTNMPFSHSAIYDAENDSVIEAEAHGVSVTPLAKFLAKAQRVWVLKPVWATPETRPLAVARARSRVGKPYDFTGLVGIPVPGTYYCTELVMDSWRPFMGDDDSDNPIPAVISPGRLHHWGRVVYDSMEIGENRNK
ncbi:MAG: hypothetical protein LBF41_00955 [Deltaproteobacteria bacterium]|nr:hypothetical protein [Deltaproteobacteria bacterium]